VPNSGIPSGALLKAFLGENGRSHADYSPSD
jgi:hypothetical protein